MKEKKNLKKKEEKNCNTKFNTKNNQTRNHRKTGGNAAVRAGSLKKMMAGIPGCRQNMSELARKIGLSYVVVRRILSEKRAENEEVQRAFAAEPKVTNAELKHRDKVERFKKCIPLCKGNIFLLAEMMGYSAASVPLMLRDKRSPELKVMFNDEQKRWNAPGGTVKKVRSELEIFWVSGVMIVMRKFLSEV